jgi:hypothetical protein
VSELEARGFFIPRYIISPSAGTELSLADEVLQAPIREELNLLRAKRDTGGYAFWVGYGGGLSEDKGGDIIANLVRFNKDVYFIILGQYDGMTSSLKSLRGTADNYYHAVLHHTEVDHFLSLVDILIAPYPPRTVLTNGDDITAHLSPLKIGQYLRVGKPIVWSGPPVIQEVLESPTNGRCVRNYACMNEWRKCFDNLFENKVSYARICDDNRKLFENSFSYSVKIKRLLLAIGHLK